MKAKTKNTETTVVERKYIHITWGDVGRFFLTLGMAGLSVLNFFLIIQIWKTLKLSEESFSWDQLAIYWVLIGQYALTASTVICLVALTKKGFRNLKPIGEFGLIRGLIRGLISGLIFGLIAEFVIGLILGLVGLISGLIFGLIVGLPDEFLS